jgi:hypothetical protein
LIIVVGILVAGVGVGAAAAVAAIVFLISLVCHLADGELPLELASKLAEDGDQLLAGLNQGFPRGERAVCLDTELNLRHIWVGD